MFDSELEVLRKKGVNQESLNRYQIAFLPENINASETPEGFLDSSDSITLCKIFRSSDLRVANSYDLGLESRTIERRSNEIWLGVIWVLEEIALPVFVSILASWLSNISGKKSPKENSQKLKQVHVKLRIMKNGNKVSLDYSGDPTTLINILRSVDEDEKKEIKNG